MSKRVTKQEQAMSLGVFRPVGYLKFGFDSARAAEEALRAFRDAGYDEADLLHYGPDEEAQLMARLLQGSSGSAEFGHEVVLMRKYHELANEGWGWVLVHAPEDADQDRALAIATRQGAKMAERYGALVIEHLIDSDAKPMASG